MTRKLAILLAMAAPMALSGCGENPLGRAPVLNVVGGSLKLPATSDRPAAGYFTIRGGPQAVELVAVTTELAQRVELHEHARDGDLMVMREIKAIPVPAGEDVVAKPGGLHLMLWGINPAAIEAGKLPAVFIFSNNDRIKADLAITDPGVAADGKHSHGGGEHKGH